MAGMSALQTIRTACCIAGGGPAGMMLGLLLARAGVEVVVLEKHADFLRDFRGDTIHPSTLTVLDDLGLLDAFLKLPHQEVTQLTAEVYGETVTIADFSHVHAARRCLVLIPQWDFLDFIAGAARKYPNFSLRMATRALGVVRAGGAREGRVVGVEAEDAASRRFAIAADLVVAADGRHTTLRGSAGLPSEDVGAPIDVLWFRLPRDAATDPERTGGTIAPGALLVTLNRASYWQCAFVIPKGAFDAVRSAGIAAFRAQIAGLAPFLAGSIAVLSGWDDVKLLSVQVSRMARWYDDGFLCLGDAAHAMSPVGGVGINLAIQDAVAAANRLAVPLRDKRLSRDDLAAVQRRRRWAAVVTQLAQVAVHNAVLTPLLGQSAAPAHTPLAVTLLQRLPLLRRLPARLVGIGVRPERVTSPAVPA